MENYHNTTNETGVVLEQFKTKAKTQDDVILNLFKSYQMKMSASEVYHLMGLTTASMTSIRRAITNLKNAGMLIKLDEKRIGLYGRAEHYYRLNSGPIQKKLF